MQPLATSLTISPGCLHRLQLQPMASSVNAPARGIGSPWVCLNHLALTLKGVLGWQEPLLPVPGLTHSETFADNMDMGAYQTRYVALEVAYLGARYHGLASQANTEETVEVRLQRINQWRSMCKRLLPELLSLCLRTGSETDLTAQHQTVLPHLGAGSAVSGAAHQQTHTAGRGLAGHTLLPLRPH